MHSYHISVSIHYYSFPQLVKSKSVEVHMETKKRIVSFQLQAQALLLVMMMVASPIMSCPPTDGRGCKDCIVNQMKNACPPCTPILHCMARCLWDGSSRPNCIKKCDCNTTYPTLSDCKGCMSKCKCSCVNYHLPHQIITLSIIILITRFGSTTML